jgi:hypothetical protein
VTAAETGGAGQDGPARDSAAPDGGLPERRPQDGQAADRPEADGRIARGGPVLPEQSREDTDAAWGEYPESADDRLNRDRPPHWDDV